MRSAGSSLPRIDAVEKVDGHGRLPRRHRPTQQAWVKIVFAGMVHGRIKAVQIDPALASPGVIAVLTASDVPVNEYGLILPDQPVLCGTGSTRQAETVRWEADHVAVVVAESAAQAAAAAKLIKLDFDPLPIVTDPEAAMRPAAPLLHPLYFSHFPYGERNANSNVLLTYHLRCGDLAAGFDQADVIVESVYHTQAQEHAFLQPEAGLAHLLPDGRIEVICAGQWMHEERHQIAHALGLPDEQIVVRYPAIGGAFGGREDISVQIALALAAWKTGRPVKTVWSREESIVGHHKRHPFTIRARWGATREGKVVAAEVDLTSDAGAYAYTSTKVLGNAMLACLGPYEIPNVQVVGRTVYTNNCPSGAFRGFGGPQGHFAAEGQVNKLAAALGMDPVELRMRKFAARLARSWPRAASSLPVAQPARCWKQRPVAAVGRLPRMAVGGRRNHRVRSRSQPRSRHRWTRRLDRWRAGAGSRSASRMSASAWAFQKIAQRGSNYTAQRRSSARWWAASARRWARAATHSFSRSRQKRCPSRRNWWNCALSPATWPPPAAAPRPAA
ncbi:MAG: xanthine dehydrogenase family protein [Caldilineaceae bacterium]|nr:xanthine dehydrogenase family protein [Caldilineaceae bacterium]